MSDQDSEDKSKAYQAKVPAVVRRINAVMAEAKRYTSKAVSDILGDLKEAGTFSTKKEAYDWLGKATDMKGVYALLNQAEALPEAQRNKTVRRIMSMAKVSRMSRLDALNEALSINKNIIKTGVQRNVTPVMNMVSKEAYSRQTFQLQKQVGVGWAIDEPPAGQIVTGMKSTLKKMSEWYHGPLDKDLRDKIVEGIATGKTHAQIAKDLQAYEVPPARAKAVARTMLTTVSNEAELTALKDTKIKRYEYVATLDERTCPVCGRLDGRKFPLNKAKAGVNFPPMHPNCRCVHVASMSDDIKEELTRSARDKNGKTIQVSGKMTYEEWVEKFGSEKAKERLAKVPKVEDQKAPKPRTPKVKVAEEPVRIQYWSTGSIKVSTPEEVEALKQKAYTSISAQEARSMSEKELEDYYVEKVDQIKSVPTPMTVEPVPAKMMKNAEKGLPVTPQDGKPEWEAWNKSLTADERQAVIDYTGADYSDINQPLWKDPDELPPRRKANTVSYVVDYYKNIDSALAKGEVKEPLSVVRGMDGNPFDTGVDFSTLSGAEIREQLKGMVGQSYTVPNYFSTSTGQGFYGDYRIHVLIPPGKGSGAYIADISNLPEEKEFLIKRNARYTILGAEKDGNTIHFYTYLSG